MVERASVSRSRMASFFEGFHLGNDHQNHETISEVSTVEKPSMEAVNSDDAVEKHARLYGAIYSFAILGILKAHSIP